MQWEDRHAQPHRHPEGGPGAAARNVIKEAFVARPLDDAQVWIDMMLHRNLLSHTYDVKTFGAVLETIEQRYFPAFKRLHEFFLVQRMAE